MTLPAPQADGLDAPFWGACRRHELVVQRCADCGTFRHPPEAICHQCLSFKAAWERVSGKGRVYSHMNVVYPTHPALADRVPYNVILVELEDAGGVRMIGNLVDCAYGEISIGMPVAVHFEDHPEAEITLPLWTRG
jgi:uncharacterized OB-fold protein